MVLTPANRIRVRRVRESAKRDATGGIPMETSPAWGRCNSCKGDIDFDQTYYVCSVSTCNRKGVELRFCSVECWDAHVPVMRHREAWAEETRSPTQAVWEREHPPADEESPPVAPTGSPGPIPSRPDPPIARLNEAGLPHDILIVVSKLKAYVRARS